jgi:acyl-CoA reductase-like NAD-dependent aldehyde dehydrogenase
VNKAERVQINYPDPLSGHIGPFISDRQAQIVDAHLDEAIAKGAVLRCGGKSFNRGGGLYMLPTVLTDVTHDMLVMREETFGPVIPVMRYNDIEEAVALANDSLYGLSAAVMAASEAEALTIARRLNAGNVSVQDAYLTFFAGPAESDKFASSGVPGKRSGLQRYLRREALLINSGKPACLLEQSMKAP